jgi:cytoskeleton protein RodZ
MSDDDRATRAPAAATAGAMLRQARQAQGMHIAVLAAAIKVSTRKLEALEADRFDELPDATFTRALAQTVCRTLKIDAAPVLALLPPPPGHRLEHVGGGINAPFRERPGQEPVRDWSLLGSPAVWAPLLLLLLAAAVYLLPPGLFNLPSLTPAASAPPVVTTTTTTMPAASAVATPEAVVASAVAAASAPSAGVTTVVETVHSAPPIAATASAPVAVAGTLLLRASAESWVQVLDGRGNTLLSRNLQAGEAVGLDGPMPLKLTVGNVTATQVSFRGQPVELAGHTRDNVARFDLR